MAKVVNSRNGQVILADVREARGPWQRFAGLMFRSSLDQGRGVLFRPARGMHTHFMRFPIDLIYLDASRRVCAVRHATPPWRLDPRRADAVIEANAGTAAAADVRVGDTLRIELG